MMEMCPDEARRALGVMGRRKEGHVASLGEEAVAKEAEM